MIYLGLPYPVLFRFLSFVVCLGFCSYLNKIVKLEENKLILFIIIVVLGSVIGCLIIRIDIDKHRMNRCKLDPLTVACAVVSYQCTLTSIQHTCPIYIWDRENFCSTLKKTFGFLRTFEICVYKKIRNNWGIKINVYNIKYDIQTLWVGLY